MATMVQVARMAGVSTSTVSHVLNNTRPVDPATRRRVMDAIKKTSYRQDTLARSLRRSRTDSIGLVVSDAGEPAFAAMVHGVEDAAAAEGMTLLLANSSEDQVREARAVQTLLGRRVDGLILALSADSGDSGLGELQGGSPPVVLLDRVFDAAPVDQVGADNRESMRRLVEHLRAAGHRRFILIAGDQRVPTLRERAAGFRDAVPASDRDDQAVIDDSEREAVDAAVMAAIRRPLRPSVIIASSTPLAVQALERLRAEGLAIPRDIAFATFDGFDHADLFEPALTTIRQPGFDMGTAAVRLLLERIERPASSPRTVRLQQTLELRTSTEAFEFSL
ncbi:LacI family transcriptional regulator [Rathayibacter tritici]|uniref:LacI family DNA-binding transcriptional regulator n=2 Tax=Rathayibacter tritici TaxID=33888 RepID=UPI000CE80559|nr:LacI family DNA-binding transcriptional regulator [Rathayibacter tritici]PPF31748.1 LacI family transcriptional regulator [Rathayibacter tritici]PPF70219.1 LacI family transcriptional regulator [Rathayibacter tritici]PPG08502.1 LacI family transcriptional regulator [Rathayibacter tritici]PPI13049.1 LacI family transcriptional regulator [Rathayibacter tritici]